MRKTRLQTNWEKKVEDLLSATKKVDEAEIAAYLDKIRSGDEDSIPKLVDSLEPLILSVVKQHPNKSVPILNLLRTCKNALTRLAEAELNATSRPKFMRFATFWIKQAILARLKKESDSRKIISATKKYSGEVERILLLQQYGKLSHNDQSLVSEIQSRQKEFSFTKRNIAKLRKLNDILRQKETEIAAQVKKIREQQTEWVKTGLIDDYELECRIALWNKKLDKLHPDFEGNPFFETWTYHIPGDSDEEYNKMLLNDNWNEFRFLSPGHPLAQDWHCYTFHHLYDHTPLTWHDLAAVDEVWIEIKVRNQFLIDIK